MMKKTTWLLAAALVGSGIVVSTPSSAQVQFGIGPDGPSVRVGPDRDRYERRRLRKAHADQQPVVGRPDFYRAPRRRAVR